MSNGCHASMAASPFSTHTALYLHCRFKWDSYKLTVIVYCLNLLYQCHFHHCDKNYKDTWHRGEKKHHNDVLTV